MPHCYCSPITAVLAYGALATVIASAIYCAVTRFVDTPFCDSLTAAQRAILADSCRTRKIVFCAGLLAAVVGLAAARPIQFACPEKT